MKKVLLLVLSVVCCFALVACSNNKAVYEEALAAKESGDYDTALELFKSIETYNDSSALVQAIIYDKAIASKEVGDYQTAADLFESLEGYEDSAVQLADVQNKIKYNEAIAAIDAGNINEAKTLFTELGNYEDSAILLMALDSLVDGVSDYTYYKITRLFFSVSDTAYQTATSRSIVGAVAKEFSDESDSEKSIVALENFAAVLPECQDFLVAISDVLLPSASNEDVLYQKALIAYWVANQQIAIMDSKDTYGSYLQAILGLRETMYRVDDTLMRECVTILEHYFVKQIDRDTLNMIAEVSEEVIKSSIFAKAFNSATLIPDIDNSMEDGASNSSAPSKSTYSSSSSSKSNNDDLKAGEYWCMGKNDTCQNKTYSPYDFYCSSCDPDGDNVEG